jgi:Matrixin
MVEADTQIGSNRHIVDSFPSRCSGVYDLQSIMTHEWGHAFDLAHETSGPDEVMYPVESPCHLRRHLGGGDWSGMDSLYPSVQHSG